MPNAAARAIRKTTVRRVLIVDDSAVARAVMTRALQQDASLAVVGAVASAPAALDFLRRERVDAIVLDIEMPGVTGLVALPELMIAGQGAKVLIVSSSCGEGAAATIEALALGAADTLVKPEVGDFAGQFSRTIAQKLARLLNADPAPAASWHPRPVAPAPTLSVTIPSATIPSAGGFDIVAIGASTGGIHALSLLLRELPAGFAAPILITQHLPTSFMPHFAAQVAVLAGRPCDIATDHMRIRRGRIVVAPGDAHMRVVRTSEGAAIRLTTERVGSGCLPSVDPMFESLAEVYGARALAIVLSGMGRDGAEGARRIAASGGAVVVQDQASSAVWGMPGSVVRGGTAHTVLPPSEIGRLVASCRRPA